MGISRKRTCAAADNDSRNTSLVPCTPYSFPGGRRPELIDQHGIGHQRFSIHHPPQDEPQSHKGTKKLDMHPCSLCSLRVFVSSWLAFTLHFYPARAYPAPQSSQFCKDRPSGGTSTRGRALPAIQNMNGNTFPLSGSRPPDCDIHPVPAHSVADHRHNTRQMNARRTAVPIPSQFRPFFLHQRKRDTSSPIRHPITPPHHNTTFLSCCQEQKNKIVVC